MCLNLCYIYSYFIFIEPSLDIDPVLFSLRVKFYPADPFRLTGVGRIMLFQQLKRDLRHGRLYCSLGEAAALGALIVQGKGHTYLISTVNNFTREFQRSLETTTR